MTNDNDDRPDTSSDSSSFGDTAPKAPRREPVFSGFELEADDDYEEPDRDTDYASSYREEDLDDEEFDDYLNDDDDSENFLPGADIQDDEKYEQDEERVGSFQETIEWEDDPEPDISDDEADTEASTGLEAEQDDLSPIEQNHDLADGDQAWSDDEDYADEENELQKWPLGLIIVAVVALLLLAAGGYGVIQQRSATQEEIRYLQAELATAGDPAELTTSRLALQDAQERNTELLAAIESLTLENRRLSDTAAGLESQLQAQQAAAAKKAAAQVAPKPTIAKPTAKAATTKPSAASGAESWFVNFSSYGQRSAAESWAAKLQPKAGKVVVTTGNKGSTTFYRVRVVELASQESAQGIARQLENEYGLSKLWVGKQQ
ncbi:MAG: SPOR domain-containing protein [Halioglobus sp.]